MYLADRPIPAHDVDAAKALLAEAGYDGAAIIYRTQPGYYTNQGETAQILQAMWAEAGLNVEVRFVENWDQVLEDNEELMIFDGSFTAYYPDPMGQFWRRFGPNGGWARNWLLRDRRGYAGQGRDPGDLGRHRGAPRRLRRDAGQLRKGPERGGAAHADADLRRQHRCRRLLADADPVHGPDDRGSVLQVSSAAAAPGPGAVLTVDGLAVAFDAEPAATGVSFALAPGEILGIVGRKRLGQVGDLPCAAGTSAAHRPGDRADDVPGGSPRAGPAGCAGRPARRRPLHDLSRTQ